MALRVTYGEPGKMNQLMQLMGYDWLSKQRHKRSLDYLQEQRRGMEEYQTRGAELTEAGRVAEHGRMTERSLQKFLQDIAKKPEIERLLSLSQYIETQPGVDPKQLRQLRQTIGFKAKEYARASSALLSENIAEIPNELLGNAVIEAGTEEFGRIARAGVTARTAEVRLGLSKEQLEFQKTREARLRKEKPGKEQEEYYKFVNDKVKAVTSYLKGLKEVAGAYKGAISIEETDIPEAEKAGLSGLLKGGILSRENLSRLLRDINHLSTIARTKTLTPDQQDFLDRAWDIVRMQEEYTRGEAIGGELYREAPPQLPRTEEEIAGIEAGFPEQAAMPAAEPMVSDEERVATLTRMILEEAAMANKDISPEEAERRARAALGIG